MAYRLTLIILTYCKIINSSPSSLTFIYYPEKKEAITSHGEFTSHYIVNIIAPHGAKLELKAIPLNLKEEKANLKRNILPWLTDTFKEEDKFYPEKFAEIINDGIFRGYRIVQIKISPEKYNPVKKILQKTDAVKVEIKFEKGEKIKNAPDKRIEKLLKKTVINYGTGKYWRKLERKKKIKQISGDFYKIKITEEGIYKITYNDLKKAGIDPSQIDPKTIKIYAITPQREIPYDVEFKEVPIYVKSGITFDKNSYILFYGQSVHGWGKNDNLYYNPYTDTMVYWLTFGGEDGLRDSFVSTSCKNPVYFEWFLDTLHIEEDIYTTKCGLAKYWELIERGITQQEVKRDYYFDIHDPYSNECKIRIGYYRYWTNYKEIDDDLLHNIKLSLNDSTFLTFSKEGPSVYRDDTSATAYTLKAGENKFTLTLFKGNSIKNDKIFFDFYEVIYRRKFIVREGELKFKAYAMDTVMFKIAGAKEKGIVFNITNPLKPIRICNTTFHKDTLIFYYPANGMEVFYYSHNFKKPLAIEKAQIDNLKKLNYGKIDYIIVSPHEFLDYAKILANYRKKIYGDTLRVCVVDFEDIVNNFTYGIRTPYALKHFLRFAYENWGEPFYCLLLGAGTFDYKEEVAKNKIPVYQTGVVVGEFGYVPANLSKCCDWWFGEFTDDDYPEMCIGRLPAKNLTEVRNILNKIKEFEKNYGDFRNKIVCTAEDEYDPSTGNINLEFTNGMEHQFVPMVPQNYDVYKIYPTEYHGTNQDESWHPGRDPGDKIGAQKELIRAISDGCYIVIYWGHGSIEQIASEKLFVNPQSIDALTNKGKYCMFLFGACGVAAFDRPSQDGMAEYLVTAENKGAILTIGSTRTVTDYKSLSKNMAKAILVDSISIAGDAFMYALLHSNRANRVLLADPLLVLSKRNHKIISVNKSDTLKGGESFTIEATTSIPRGYAVVTCFSSAYLDSPDYDVNLKYYSRGYVLSFENYDRRFYDVLFKGIYKIENYKIKAKFFIPNQNLITGNLGRISIYIYDENGEASLGIDSIPVVKGRPKDTIPPEVILYANGELIKNRAIVPKKFVLSGVIWDSSGINIAEKEGPYAMSLSINDSQFTYPKCISDYFKYDINNPYKGSFSYVLNLEPDDSAVVYFKVSDNAGNRKVIKFTAIIKSTGELKIMRALNYPNPVKGNWTKFRFYLTDKADIKILIYTIKGRLVKKIELSGYPGFNEIMWDLRDDFGDIVSNGVYLYEIKAKGKGQIAKCRGKIVILR